ncbi:TldD/PmbA family protein [Clostridium saccharobutylicum]|uniref:Protein PmbA n=1 Tax=Clostridium saccharobutylicum DSM 13864 TaxID=1345695 RepID=U5MLM5_CLOSA|nr:TldD/PmbA family protein [Clostridium saccharobutylicum]AGX41490.1 protein PmbA [Clostridium saccharobutylicum DSM 13864]AQR88770.1 metalloprotease PmbA [Clostridium saccharobutylicum]AQR98668.1 metalloprotease PmbA [Clostridium saccharobutylicum]AQS08392.1 metalloprotease PmbA [Clostridium saccharobutylicum]AQS12658.1 metalloprotease PmbA [Clostridium saccharobutylicum]
MDISLFKEELFKEAKKNGFEECEIFYSDAESLSLNIYEGEVEKYKLNNAFGLSFRGKINGKMGYSYTEILDKDAISMLINNAKGAAIAIENDDVQFIYEGDKEYKNIDYYKKELDSIKPDEYIKLALEMEQECKKQCDKVVNFGGCGIGYGKSSYGIMNSKGLDLKSSRNSLTAYVVPIIEDGDQKYDGMGYVVAKKLGDIEPKKLAKQGLEEALSKVGGKSIPSGKYKIIINNEAMVSLLGTFDSIFDAEQAQKGLSLLKGKEGEVIASNIVTLVDDPHLKDGLGSCCFDDEGVATYKKEIISNGKLNTLLYNLKTAHKAGVKSTANGFKSSYASIVGTSATNFYINPGKKSFEELCEDVKDGVILTEFAGLHSGASSVTGDFSLAAKGFMIENGKKTFPIEQITVAGNFFTLLKDIEEVGSDLKFPMSSIGCPSVIIKELSIAGK